MTVICWKRASGRCWTLRRGDPVEERGGAERTCDCCALRLEIPDTSLLDFVLLSPTYKSG